MGGGVIYSTDEICIGYTNINGIKKKLYSKTFRDTCPSTAGATKNIVVGSTMTDVPYAFARFWTNGLISYSNTIASDNVISVWARTADNATNPNTIAFTCTSQGINLPCEITIQYTKD